MNIEQVIESIHKNQFYTHRELILRLASNEDTYSTTYAFAWDRGVYPLHEQDYFSNEFERHFNVRKTWAEDLFSHLADEWDSGRRPSFDDLEKTFQVPHHSRDREASTFTENSLADTLRYFSFYNLFDVEFWKGIKNSNFSGVPQIGVVPTTEYIKGHTLKLIG